jgi:hypothetical protein
MVTRQWSTWWVGTICSAMLVALTVHVLAQEIVRTGPPPELRAHMDAFVRALNATGTATDEWEVMAKAAFTPELLKRETPAQRKQVRDTLRAQFGTITIQGVERQGGPDAPLQVRVKGTVASGTIWIDIDDASRFDSIKGEVQKG